MALTSQAITAAILAADPTLTGPSWLQLAQVLGTAVRAWVGAPGNLVLTGVTSGFAGAGTVTGTFAVPPNPAALTSAVASAGLLGVIAPQMALAVGAGVSAAFSATATYAGVSAGVGSGTDISAVAVSNGPALSAAILTAAASANMTGVLMPQIASGFGTGIAVLLMGGTGVGVVSGPGGRAAPRARPARGVGLNLQKTTAMLSHRPSWRSSRSRTTRSFGTTWSGTFLNPHRTTSSRS